MLKPRNDARLSPCEAFWQKHNGFLCEKPILPYEHSAKGKGFFLSRWREKAPMLLLSISAVSQDLYFSVQNDIWIFFCKVLHFFRVAVNAKEHKVFISVLFIPIYFFRFFKQVVIHINTKRFFGIFAFAEDDVIGIICCDNIDFCIFSVPPFADFCGSETEK